MYNISVRTKSDEEFRQYCEHMYPKRDSKSSQIHLSGQSYRYDLVADRSNPIMTHLHVFLFDFSMISGDVYIDFAPLNTTDMPRASGGVAQTLVISLVTRQFLTFRLLNVPSRKTELFSRLVLLLNGESSVDLIENTLSDDRLPVEVYHSPIGSTGQTWVIYKNYFFMLIRISIY